MEILRLFIHSCCWSWPAIAIKIRIHSIEPEIIAYFFIAWRRRENIFKPSHRSIKLDLVVFTVADLYNITWGILHWVIWCSGRTINLGDKIITKYVRNFTQAWFLVSKVYPMSGLGKIVDLGKISSLSHNKLKNNYLIPEIGEGVKLWGNWFPH